MSNVKLDKSNVNLENYMTIEGWMRTKLGLKGADLIVYAIIFGFSQVDNQYCECSLQYFADWTGSCKRSIQDSLDRLVKSELIIKEVYLINNVKRCKYRFNKILMRKLVYGDEPNQEVIHNSTKEDEGGMENIAIGMANSAIGIAKIATNIIVNNIVQTIRIKYINNNARACTCVYVRQIVDYVIHDNLFMIEFRQFSNYTNVVEDKVKLKMFITANTDKFRKHGIIVKE